MTVDAAGASIGLDFGTTNTVVAIGAPGASPDLLTFAGPRGDETVFRSALCFWQDERGIAAEAGPWAIDEYLQLPQDSRFIQSFKSIAASQVFEHASVFDKRYRFEDLGRLFLAKLASHAGGRLDGGKARVVIGRPVEYAGARPDPALARQRYDAMFAGFGAELLYVYEPLAAAFSYAARLAEPATVLVADFGGGTSDFSVVRIGAPGSANRCRPLGHAGIGIAGDQFDRRIVEKLVLPLIGAGGTYRSFDKILDIPRGYFSDFSDWSRLAFMRNRKTLAELDRLKHSATDPAAIGRLITIVEEELGFQLYDTIGRLKRALSAGDHAHFRFAGGGMAIEADVARAEFERWIAPDVERIEATVDRALGAAEVAPGDLDRVFLTGGSSLIPRIKRIFTDRFGESAIAAGQELTSIADGLALIGQQDDATIWAS